MVRHTILGRFFQKYGILSVAAIATAMALQSASAATWIGPVDGTGSWSDGNNWDPIGMPGAGVEAYFGESAKVNAAADHYANIKVAAGKTLTLTGTNYSVGRPGGTGQSTISGDGEIVLEGTNTFTGGSETMFVRTDTKIDIAVFTNKINGVTGTGVTNTLQINGVISENVQKIVQDSSGTLMINAAQPSFNSEL